MLASLFLPKILVPDKLEVCYTIVACPRSSQLIYADHPGYYGYCLLYNAKQAFSGVLLDGSSVQNC